MKKIQDFPAFHALPIQSQNNNKNRRWPKQVIKNQDLQWSVTLKSKFFVKFQCGAAIFSELTRLHAEMENIRLECARLMNQRNGTPKSAQPQQATSQTQQAISLMSMIEKLSSSVHQNTR
jgi:hypothetical protein